MMRHFSTLKNALDTYGPVLIEVKQGDYTLRIHDLDPKIPFVVVSIERRSHWCVVAFVSEIGAECETKSSWASLEAARQLQYNLEVSYFYHLQFTEDPEAQ